MNAPAVLTPAEIKTCRESLGLTAQALGARLGGVADRTIRRWESGDSAPESDDVATLLRRLEAAVEHIVRRAVEHVAAMTGGRGTAPADVVLLRYRDDADLARHQPETAVALAHEGAGAAGLHAVALDRIRVALARRGQRVRLVWFDPAGYETWRRRGAGLADDANARAAWAARQLPGAADESG